MLRNFVFQKIPRPQRENATPPKPFQRLIVIIHNFNPTYEYYLQERLAYYQSLGVKVCVVSSNEMDVLDPNNAFVIVCRYIKKKQLEWLEMNKERLSGVGLLIDDDIASIIVGSESPISYKLFVTYMGLLQLKRLNKLLSVIWVSTPRLRKALSAKGCESKLLQPFPPLPSVLSRVAGSVPSDSPIRIVYHATVTHFFGHEFLKPVMETVLAKHPNVHFEVFGRSKSRRVWKHAKIDPSQLNYKQILPWGKYKDHCLKNPADIALAPLFENDVDNVRSDTKRIDIARLGAAAIFSEGHTYARCKQKNEMFAQNKAELWKEKIEFLIAHNQFRRKSAEATAFSIQIMRNSADIEFPGISRELS